MQAMIQNDEQKKWMQPILDFRNQHLAGEDRAVRDFRRMNGRLTVFRGELVHGPYTQEHRAKLLKELLRAQQLVRGADQAHGSQTIELISLAELQEIRRIWIEEKGEIEDLVPQIYREATGAAYPGKDVELPPLDGSDLKLLRDVASELDPQASEELYRLTRKLLAVQFQTMGTGKRSKHLDRLDDVLHQHAFRNEAEAREFALSNGAGVDTEGDAPDAESVIV